MDKQRAELEAIMSGKAPTTSEGAPRRWPLTNQIWHLGEGRVASSRQEFQIAALRSVKDRGKGDKYAYPPDGSAEAPAHQWTMRNLFRNSVGIPIFTRGGQTEYVPQRTDAWWSSEPDATRPEFHRAYRVIGILKLEGKQPRAEIIKDPANWWKALSQTSRAKIETVLGSESEATRAVWGKSLDEQAANLLATLYKEKTDATGLGRKLLSTPEGEVDEKLVDELSEVFDARWEPEDIELLVAIAMELGRLLTMQTLRRATRDGIVIGENDVGLLDIRPRDIAGIRLCHIAADRVSAKVEHALQSVQIALVDEQRRGTRSGRIVEPTIHKPIVSVERRRKPLVSLFRKCIQKELTQTRPDSCMQSRNITFAPGLEARVRDWNPLSSPERIIQGRARLKALRDAGTEGDLKFLETDLRHGGKRVRLSRQEGPVGEQTGLSFCERVFSRDQYGIDDWAAVSVVCHFLSDVDMLFNAIQATFPQCGIRIDPEDVERWLEFAQADGYRGIHMTVHVSLRHLLSEEQHKDMLNLLESTPGSKSHLVKDGEVRPADGDRLPSGGCDKSAVAKEREVWFPCEIQIRTAYQHSWSRATHPLLYKRKDVPEELHGHMQALSGMLFESDKIVDLIRRRIEVENVRYAELMEFLQDRIPDESLALVHFGAEFALEYHRENLQYGGEPLFGYLLDAADCLVRSLGIDDPFMVLSAFFHNLWMDDAGKSWEKLEEHCQDPASPKPGVIPFPNTILKEIDRKIQIFCESAARRHSAFVVRRLRSRIPDQWPMHSPADDASYAFGKVPVWFKELLVVYMQALHPFHKGSRTTRLRLLLERVEYLKEVGDRAHGEELERRGCVVETAIQLSRLRELPNDPHKRRAVRDFEEIYQILEQIRRRIGDDLRPVLRRAETSLRLTADKLGTHLPIDWEG